MPASREPVVVMLAALAALGLDVGVVLGGEPVLGIAMLPLLVLCVVLPAVSSVRGARVARREHLAARRDELTGLPNAVQLREDIASLVAGDGASTTLVIFDLVGFKKYNDAYGFACGDTMLRRLGRRFTEAAGDDGGVVYRLRGAQFAILSTASRSALAEQCRRCGDALFEGGEGFMIRCVYGAVDVPAGHTASEALKLADQEVQSERTRLSREGFDETAPMSGDTAVRVARSAYEVDTLSTAVGRRLGLADDALETLESAAALRDVGMMSIPDAVVHAPAALTDDDWRFVELHTLVGERLLRSNFGMHAAASVVRSSHERWDGAGYPDGLAGEAIPLSSRIVFVCSAFQDMTSLRAHRPALTAAEAMAELQRGAGTQFDPAVVRAFIAAFDRLDRRGSAVSAAG